MSDYIDENFELDETDEFWGIEDHEPNQLIAQDNDFNIITERCLPLKDDIGLKIKAGYKYADKKVQAKYLREIGEWQLKGELSISHQRRL